MGGKKLGMEIHQNRKQENCPHHKKKYIEKVFQGFGM